MIIKDREATTRLLISGSRNATPDMLTFARECVRSAYIKGFTILVGDATGVDEAVAQACIDYFDLHPAPQQDAPENHHLWTPCTIYGIQPKPRHSIAHPNILYTHLTTVTIQNRHVTGTASRKHLHVSYTDVRIDTYTKRDEYMVNCATSVMCIWDGHSHGTKRVNDYALSFLGKQAWIKNFGKSK